MADFTPQNIIDLEAMAVEGFAYTEANATAEQKAALEARITGMVNDPEAAKAEAMTRMSTAFAECDVD